MNKKILLIIGLIIIVVLFCFAWIYSNVKQLSVSQSYPSSGMYAPSISLGVGGSSRELSTKLAQNETADSVAKTDSSADRMVIQTGSINMVVDEISPNVQKISEYAESKDGWVVNSSVDGQLKPMPLAETKNSVKPVAGYITFRVPVENFGEAMGYIRSLAKKVESESTQSQDITEEYTDLESRLRNLEAAEKELLKIMERSGEIADVLAVQRELNNVREQIEQLKGRVKYLEQNVKMATITVNLALSEDQLPIEPGDQWRPKYVLLQAWNSVVNFLKGFSYFFIWLVVYAIIWVPLAIIVWLTIRFLQRKKTE